MHRKQPLPPVGTPLLAGSQEFASNQRTSSDKKKVFGVPWNVAHDQLTFNLKGITNTALHLDPTKRNIVRLIGKIYNPLGFLSPVTIY